MTNGNFQAPREEHPFARYVRILGKGKTGSRSLSLAEAETAFGMILRGEVEDLQLGAFLMLLRVKEESPEELAGFVNACRTVMNQPSSELCADLDWSSYAGKKHQHPWYVLSALLLAESGLRVFMHGAEGHTQGRLYTEQTLCQLDIPVAENWQAVANHLRYHNFAYMPLRNFCLPLQRLIQLKPLLGLRSPVNTLTRMMNPLAAPYSLQSIFHPDYAHLHLEADKLLGQPHSLVFKGDSGEVEIKPHADTRLALQRSGERENILWTREISERPVSVSAPAAEPLRRLWHGEQDDQYGLGAVLNTAATALLLTERAKNSDEALSSALALWQQRDRTRL